MNRTPSLLSLIHYLTLEARGGQEWLHATWRRDWDPGEPRGPAARGWCKTTPARGPGGLSGASERVPGAPRCPGAWPARSRIWGPRTPGSRRGSPAPGGGVPGSRPGVPGSRPAPARGVLHQPLAPGPRGIPGRSRGPGVPEGPPGPPGRPGSHPARTGVQKPLPGNRGAPARGVDVKPPPGASRDREF